MEKRLPNFNVEEILLCPVIWNGTAVFRRVGLNFGKISKGIGDWDGQEFQVCECKGSGQRDGYMFRDGDPCKGHGERLRVWSRRC